MSGAPRVVSISLDATIATDDGPSRQRQREYATHFKEYVVVVKTEGGDHEVVEEGPLTLVPTNSRNRYTFVLDAYLAVVKIAESRDVDVITVQDPFVLGALGLVLKRRTGAALHTQAHIDFFDNPDWVRGSHKRRLSGALGRWVLQRSDAIRVGTEYERSKLREFVSDKARVHCAPVRIDVDSLTGQTSPTCKKETREKLALGDRPVVFFAGRFVPQKNLRKFVDVAEGVCDESKTNPIFLLTGDGPLREEIMAEVEVRGLANSFRFPGFVSEETLSCCYDIADICLLTSDFEGTCRVLIEAGLNELPVVATPFAGARDNLIHGETGYVESDISALAERVVELLEDDEKRHAFGERSYTYLAERFDPDQLVDEYVEFLQPD
jgi:glycosyltransferase involved in cell wall biosynthesis